MACVGVQWLRRVERHLHGEAECGRQLAQADERRCRLEGLHAVLQVEPDSAVYGTIM